MRAIPTGNREITLSEQKKNYKSYRRKSRVEITVE